jgi:abhydrolase domain-containing protein 11
LAHKTNKNSLIGTTQSDIPLFLHAMQSIQVSSKHTIHQARVVADEKLSAIIKEKSLRDFLITNLVKTESGDFKWRINLETLNRCFQDGVAKFPNVEGMRFDGPTLFIGGSKSDYLK